MLSDSINVIASFDDTSSKWVILLGYEVSFSDGYALLFGSIIKREINNINYDEHYTISTVLLDHKVQSYDGI